MHDTFHPSETPPFPVSRAQSVFAPQSLERFDRATRRQPKPDPQAPWRRAIVFGGALAITAYLLRELYLVLSVGGIGGLEMVLMVLFTINIFWLGTLLYDRACRLRGDRAGHEALPRPGE